MREAPFRESTLGRELIRESTGPIELRLQKLNAGLHFIHEIRTLGVPHGYTLDRVAALGHHGLHIAVWKFLVVSHQSFPPQ